MARLVLITDILSKRLTESEKDRVDEIIEKINAELEASEELRCSFVLEHESKNVCLAVAAWFKSTKNLHDQIGWRVKLILSDLVTRRIEISAF